MTEAVRAACSWLDRLEQPTEWYAGALGRRWSWFQIAWAGLHASAVVMHVLSVVYHARRVQQDWNPNLSALAHSSNHDAPAEAWLHELGFEVGQLRRSA